MDILIFVTLGTQDKPFTRLLEALDRQIENGNITEEVVVQTGFTKYKSNRMKVFDLIDKQSFEHFINEADLLITHGGVGSIISGLNNKKRIIAVPRLAKYGEHMNDHQLQIIKCFEKKHFIIPLYDFSQFEEVLKISKSFIPKEYKSNNSNFVSFIDKIIENEQSNLQKRATHWHRLRRYLK